MKGLRGSVSQRFFMSETIQGNDTSLPIIDRLRESEAMFTALAPLVCILVSMGFILWAAATAAQDAISQALHSRRARMAKIPHG